MDNYIEFLTDRTFPCPLCEKTLDIRIDKNDKPYVICGDCCVQLFIRGEDGIDRLCQIVDRPW